MKIFVALFYPLIASLLLLPSDAGAQKDNSKDTTVPTGDEYFTPENLAKTCKVCSMFNVDPVDCLANANGEARKHCREMVFEMSNKVEKQWKKLSGNKGRMKANAGLGAVITFQRPLSDIHRSATHIFLHFRKCEPLITASPCAAASFAYANDIMDKLSRSTRGCRIGELFMGCHRSPTLPIGEEYFTPENLAKTCKICNIFKVDSYDCLANANGEARMRCREMVFEMSFAVAKHWIIISGKNTMVSTGEVYFTPEHLAKTCKICNIFKVDSYDCLANAYGEARKKCREMVFEMSNTVAKQWKKLSVKKRIPAAEKDALPIPVPARVY